ncbi:MAG: DUF3995 domain-containing protein, partial [Salana multivorans]|nr:DUF3995 domain-containing protein [Salana multivorans]
MATTKALARVLATAGLSGAAALHAAWAAGSSWPAADDRELAELVTGSGDIGMPPRTASLAVAVLLGGAALAPVAEAEPGDRRQHGQPDRVAGDGPAVPPDHRVARHRQRGGRRQRTRDHQRPEEVGERRPHDRQPDVHRQEGRDRLRPEGVRQLAQQHVADVAGHRHVVSRVQLQGVDVERPVLA